MTFHFSVLVLAFWLSSFAVGGGPASVSILLTLGGPDGPYLNLVPHLRDGFIVDKRGSPPPCWWGGKVGHHATRDPLSLRCALNPPPGPTRRTRSNPPHQSVVHPEPGRALQSGHKGPPRSGHRSTEGRSVVRRTQRLNIAVALRQESPHIQPLTTLTLKKPQQTRMSSPTLVKIRRVKRATSAKSITCCPKNKFAKTAF